MSVFVRFAVASARPTVAAVRPKSGDGRAMLWGTVLDFDGGNCAELRSPPALEAPTISSIRHMAILAAFTRQSPEVFSRSIRGSIVARPGRLLLRSGPHVGVNLQRLCGGGSVCIFLHSPSRLTLFNGMPQLVGLCWRTARGRSQSKGVSVVGSGRWRQCSTALAAPK